MNGFKDIYDLDKLEKLNIPYGKNCYFQIGEKTKIGKIIGIREDQYIIEMPNKDKFYINKIKLL